MQALTSVTSITFDEALAAARRGSVTREAASSLIRAREGDELESLLAEASSLRDRVKGRRITYSKKVFIPLTNLCRDYCGYCTFRQYPDQTGARKRTPDD